LIFIQSNKKFQGCGLPQPFLLVGSTAEKKTHQFIRRNVVILEPSSDAIN